MLLPRPAPCAEAFPLWKGKVPTKWADEVRYIAAKAAMAIHRALEHIGAFITSSVSLSLDSFPLLKGKPRREPCIRPLRHCVAQYGEKYVKTNMDAAAAAGGIHAAR